MKRMLLLFTFAAMALAPVAFADEIAPAVAIPSEVHVKQGMLLRWKDPEAGVMNLSTVTIAQTDPYAPFGKWNALWAGWTLDAGWTYDANTSSAALLVGRHFGTLGDYLPVSFPLADKLDITIYPLGVVVDDPFNHPTVQGASGLGIIKFDLSF